MTRQAWTWVFVALSAPCLSVAQTMSEDSIMFWTSPVVDTLHWGPEPGTVQWSFNDHALHWSTSRLSLDLDPWLFRHVSGNVHGEVLNQINSGTTCAALGSRQHWMAVGTCKEASKNSSLPGAWDAAAMTTATALPGWLPRCCQMGVSMWHVHAAAHANSRREIKTRCFDCRLCPLPLGQHAFATFLRPHCSLSERGLIGNTKTSSASVCMPKVDRHGTK